MAKNTWYRLDNIGKFYASQAGNSVQTVFRYAATLVDEVDASVLQYALEHTTETFPEFNVCLRSGLFWHYLEQATELPHCTQESLPICYGLHVHAKSILFRVSYYQHRINFEVSHIISDGRGALNFFKVLLYTYLQKRYEITGVQPCYDGSDHEKSENSFNKYYEPDKAASKRTAAVFHLGGWRDVADPTFIEYHLPTSEVLALARSYKVSITSLVIAALVSAIRTEMPQRALNRPIRIDVPVDLRRFFTSATTKNFFGLAYVSYTPYQKNETVEAIAGQIHAQLESATDPEKLKLRMNQMIALEKNALVRLAPLFIKDAVLGIAAWMATRETTTTVSNIGVIPIDKKLAPFITDINLLTSTRGLNCIVCSFGNDLSISLSSVFANPTVIKNFCRYFSQCGITGTINTNKGRSLLSEHPSSSLARSQP